MARLGSGVEEQLMVLAHGDQVALARFADVDTPETLQECVVTFLISIQM